MVKMIKLEEPTYNRLKSLGKKGDTFEDIVIMLLDGHKEKKRNATV